MHYQCSLAAAAGSRCIGARSGVVTERGSRGIGAAQKVTGPPMGGKHKENLLLVSMYPSNRPMKARRHRHTAQCPVMHRKS